MQVNFNGMPIDIPEPAQKQITWYKDTDDEWAIESIRCGNCNAILGWQWGIEKYCPNCGSQFMGTLNPTPPGEEK